MFKPFGEGREIDFAEIFLTCNSGGAGNKPISASVWCVVVTDDLPFRIDIACAIVRALPGNRNSLGSSPGMRI